MRKTGARENNRSSTQTVPGSREHAPAVRTATRIESIKVGSPGGFASKTERKPGTTQCPWLRSVEHQKLYNGLQSQKFEGYGCVDTLMNSNYTIPNESIDLASRITSAGGFPQASTRRGAERYVGFDTNSLKEFKNGDKDLTVGKAIQEIFMLRLREDNNNQPITNLNEVWPKLFQGSVKGTVYLGDMVDSLDFQLLEKLNITAMVSIHPEDWRSNGRHHHGKNGRRRPKSPSPIVERLYLNLEDNPSADMGPKFDHVYDFIKKQVDAEKNVLIHCMMGQSRSGTLALYFALRLKMQKQSLNVNVKPGTPEKDKTAVFKGLDTEGLLHQLKKARPGVDVANFMPQLNNKIRKLCFLKESALPKPVDKGPPKAANKLQEAILIAFCLYRLRPTPAVKKMISTVEKTFNKYQARFPDKVVLPFVSPLKKWIEECETFETLEVSKQYLKFGQ